MPAPSAFMRSNNKPWTSPAGLINRSDQQQLINRPHDRYEQEATAIAGAAAVSGSLDNGCISCGVDAGSAYDIAHVDNPVNSSPSTFSPSSTSFQRSGSGFPLDSSTRETMETRIGYDFGKVRIHADTDSSRSAVAINAAAYTVGNDIVFGEGQYRPDTQKGLTLLAHELVHTVQQQGTSAKVGLSAPTGIISQVTPHIQREILTYNSEHEEIQPSYGESTAVIYDVYSAESSTIRGALQALITSGKVGAADDGRRTFFYNRSATHAEALAALTAAGLSSASQLVDALMDNHNVFVYSGSRVTKMTSLFWTSTLGTATNVVERQTRRLLTDFEKNEARLVYGSNLNLDRIVVEEDPVMSLGGYARTTPWTINFPSGALGSSNFMSWLIHELGHSWQYQHGYSVATTLYHAIRGVYDYGGEAGLIAAYSAGNGLSSFNTEQQADIARDYYRRLKSGQSVAAWLPFINEFKGIP